MSNQVEVLYASENKAGMTLIEEQEPDVVFVDCKSKSIDVLSILRSVEVVRSNISVVALAEKEDLTEALALLRRGVRDYFSHPMEGKEALVDKLIRRAGIRSESIGQFLNNQDVLEATNQVLSRDLHHLQEDQEAGRYVQLKLFPETPIAMSSCVLEHKIIPSLYLSGDFIEYFPINEEQFVFYLADVSGHGASSAFITILLKLTTNQLRDKIQSERTNFSPKQLLENANSELVKMQLGKHLTIFCGLVDSSKRTLTYSLGAHYPPPILLNNGEYSTITDKALPIGVFEHAEFTDTQIHLSEEFSISLFSDGIMEVLEGQTLDEKEKVLFEKVKKSGGSMTRLVELLSLEDIKDAPDDIGLLVISSL